MRSLIQELTSLQLPFEQFRRLSLQSILLTTLATSTRGEVLHGNATFGVVFLFEPF
jgi:hypothetical protein